jgi:hypothetical protein
MIMGWRQYIDALAETPLVGVNCLSSYPLDTSNLSPGQKGGFFASASVLVWLACHYETFDRLGFLLWGLFCGHYTISSLRHRDITT